MPNIQMGTGIGQATPGPGNPGDKGDVKDVIGPDTDAGQALLLAAAGLGLLGITVARSQTGVVQKAGAVLETVLIIAAGAWSANYFARIYTLRHPDGPLAGGLTLIA